MGMFAGLPYMVGPLVVVVVIGTLALVLRWTYGSSRAAPPPPVADDADYGLLREVTTVENLGEANALRAVLSDAGIRSTSARAGHGRIRVLVFAADLDRARQLAGPR
jgi:hypothetical protein